MRDVAPSEWHTDAACNGLDTRLFFPKSGEETSAPLAVCGVCPVRQVCLEENLHEERGIWGGTTALERRRIRRQRRREQAA